MGRTYHKEAAWPLRPLKSIQTGPAVETRGRERTLSGAEANTTNNRMELMAAIKALESLKRPCKVTLFTDSVYVQKGISEWLRNWKRRGWKTADKKPVKNADLWRRLDAAAEAHDIRWRWVRGHSGHPENELVDALAREAIQTLKR